MKINLHNAQESDRVAALIRNDLQLQDKFFPFTRRSVMDAIAKACPLGTLRPGQKGRISGLDPADLNADLEDRLLRLGFAEDAEIEVLHEGPVGRDPMAVKVDGVLIALRRREADTILITLDPSS